MILFLNGVSSSGKTTLSKCIQSISDRDFIRIGIDTFIDMMSPDYLYHGSKIDKGLYFTIKHTQQGPSVEETHLGPLAKNLLFSMPEHIKLLSQKGIDIIVDEVIWEEERMKKYINCLENEHVYFIKVFADLDLMMKRELLRGDRIRGLVLGQHEKVHLGNRSYDLEIDTTTLSPFILAENILNFIQEHPSPKGFKKMQKKL